MTRSFSLVSLVQLIQARKPSLLVCQFVSVFIARLNRYLGRGLYLAFPAFLEMHYLDLGPLGAPNNLFDYLQTLASKVSLIEDALLILTDSYVVQFIVQDFICDEGWGSAAIVIIAALYYTLLHVYTLVSACVTFTLR